MNLLFSADGKTATAQILITIDNDAKGINLITGVAHEGSHAADRQAYAQGVTDIIQREGGSPQLLSRIAAFSRSWYNPTVRRTETLAYYVSAYVAQGSGEKSYSPGGVEIWNSAWSPADRSINMAMGIERILTEDKRYKNRLTDRLFEQER